MVDGWFVVSECDPYPYLYLLHDWPVASHLLLNTVYNHCYHYMYCGWARMWSFLRSPLVYWVSFGKSHPVLFWGPLSGYFRCTWWRWWSVGSGLWSMLLYTYWRLCTCHMSWLLVYGLMDHVVNTLYIESWHVITFFLKYCYSIVIMAWVVND